MAHDWHNTMCRMISDRCREIREAMSQSFIQTDDRKAKRIADLAEQVERLAATVDRQDQELDELRAWKDRIQEATTGDESCPICKSSSRVGSMGGSEMCCGTCGYTWDKKWVSE